VAAFVLARAGWDVEVIEQHRFPRDKVCGECLSALGIDVLTRLGLREAIATLRPMELTRAAIVAADGSEAVFTLPRPMWGVSRSALDVALLNVAMAAGARVVQPARCEGLTNGPLSLRVRHLTTNQISTHAADTVLLADGRATFAQDAPRSTGDLGVKAHFTNVADSPADCIALFALAGHYVGLAPIEANRWNLAMSVPAAKVKAHRGDLDAIFATILGENPRLAERLRGARRVGDWLASPLPRFGVRRRWPANVIPIGNAAAAIEPIGGEGMGLAMRSAELVAEELIEADRTGRAYAAAALKRQMRALWRTRRFGCRAGAVLVSSPLTARLATRTAPRVRPVVMKLIGK
jgi:flavin-dependent dehydrogenase